MDWARDRATRSVARRRDQFLFRALAAGSTLFLDMMENRSYDMTLNGELEVLRLLAQARTECIFDVGANVGDWSIAAAGLLPGVQIHAFEIVSETAEIMRQRLASAQLSDVRVNAMGLSQESGTVRVAYLPGFSQGSSAAVVQPGGDVEWRACPVRTGDEYCRENGIEHIDFLKIDVEGFEARVLKGFHAMLSGGKVAAVQFEYGHLNASVRFLLGDFYDLFEEYGFAVGKIFPDYVDFRDYNSWRDENFRGPNYLAVHRGQTELIRRFSTPEASPRRTWESLDAQGLLTRAWRSAGVVATRSRARTGLPGVRKLRRSTRR